MTDVRIEGLAHAVIGASIEVHRELGPGFLESAYENALAIELAARGIPFERQAPIHVIYKGRSVGEGRVDFLVDRSLVVELKTVDFFSAIHIAQVLSYLRATGLPLALLVNFNVPVMKHGIKRVIASEDGRSRRPDPGE